MRAAYRGLPSTHQQQQSAPPMHVLHGSSASVIQRHPTYHPHQQQLPPQSMPPQSVCVTSVGPVGLLGSIGSQPHSGPPSMLPTSGYNIPQMPVAYKCSGAGIPLGDVPCTPARREMLVPLKIDTDVKKVVTSASCHFMWLSCTVLGLLCSMLVCNTVKIAHSSESWHSWCTH